MSTAIKFPAARQAVIVTDDKGQEVFTRPWFLFFQQVYERIGGPVSMGLNDIASSSFGGTGSSELNSMIFTLDNAVGQIPLRELMVAVDQLMTECAELRSTVAELTKEVEGLKQGQMI